MSISTGNIAAEKVKGRGFIRIDRRAFAEVFPDLDIKKTDLQGILHDTGVLATIHQRLLLPESYSALGIYMEFLRGTWCLVVESHDLPTVEANRELPQIVPIYRRNEDGTNSLDHITVEVL